jgi:hypothetical protein
VHKKTPNSDQGRAYFGPQMIDDWSTLVLKKQSNYPVEMSKKKKKYIFDYFFFSSTCSSISILKVPVDAAARSGHGILI